MWLARLREQLAENLDSILKRSSQNFHKCTAGKAICCCRLVHNLLSYPIEQFVLDLELGVIPNFWNTSKMATSKTNSSKRSSIRGNKKFPCLSHRYICLSGHPTNTLRNLVEVIRNTAIWLARSNNSDEIATLQERETFELHSKALYHSIYTHRYLHVNSLRCEFSRSSYIRGVGRTFEVDRL